MDILANLTKLDITTTGILALIAIIAYSLFLHIKKITSDEWKNSNTHIGYILVGCTSWGISVSCIFAFVVYYLYILLGGS